MKIEFKNIEETNVAYIPATGSYEQLPGLFGEVVGYVMKEELQLIEPPYGIFFNNSMEVPPEELEFEIGIPYIGDATGEGRVKVKKVPAHQVASTIYKGPYGQAAQVYKAIIDYTMKNGYEIIGAVKEIYITNPMEVDEDKLLTEVRFPIAKRE